MTTIIDLLPLELIGKITLSVDDPITFGRLLVTNTVFRQSISEKELKQKRNEHDYTFDCLGTPEPIENNYHDDYCLSLFGDPLGIALDLDTGNIYVADYGNECLRVFTRNGEIVTGPNLNTDNPRGIVIMKDRTIISISPDKLYNLGKIQDDKSKMPCLEYGVSSLAEPFGIAVNSKNHIVMSAIMLNNKLTDCRPDCIMIVGPVTGDVLDTFTFELPRDDDFHDFHEPGDVCVDEFDNVFSTDISENCIHMFDEKGKYIKKFGSKGRGDGQFTNPSGICVNKRTGQIIVADNGNARLSIWSGDGEFIRHISNLPSHPTRLAVTKLGKKAIVSFQDNTVRCISLTG